MSDQFYTIEQIGPKRSITPEGFLLCEEVPVARTGTMIYGPNEIPVDAGPDNLIHISREDSEVFRPETITSANGKPVTLSHPDDDVTHVDWKELAIGVMMNPRRGEGSRDDLLLADLLITTTEGIEAVNNGIREVSLGYVADYYETGPGRGNQINILINHVALVEQGRCGPRCSIKDSKLIPIIENNPKESQMTLRKQSKFEKLVYRAFRAGKTQDSEELSSVLDDAEEIVGEKEKTPTPKDEGELHVHVDDDGELAAHIAQNAAEHQEFRDRLDALEAKLNTTQDAEGLEKFGDEVEESEQAMLDEVPEGLETEAAKANDSKYLRDSFRDTMSKAEILSPGIQLMTFDAASKPGDTFKQICTLRRKALQNAFTNDSALAKDLNSGKPLKLAGMSCQAVKAMFNAAYLAKRQTNNLRTVDGASQLNIAQPVKKEGAIMSLADLNKANQKFYGAKKP